MRGLDLDPAAPGAWEAARRLVEAVTPAAARSAVEGPDGRPAALPALVSPAAAEHLETLAERARAITRRRFGRVVVLYVPLYVSNECVNGCTYCGFSRDRCETARLTLSPKALGSELDALKAHGFDHLLLLTGEDRRAAPPAAIEAAVAAAHERFASVSVEVYPMSGKEYGRLVAAGCDGLTLYQETYDRRTYAAVHPRGPKRDFDGRLLAPLEAARAGLRSVSIGALLGLADFRAEAVLMACHGQGVRRASWRTRLGFGFPRLRNEPGGGVDLSPVSDRDLAQLIFATRIAFPDAELVLSTREPPALRDGLAGLGVTRMSAGSRTRPGGYAEGLGPGGEQFPVVDRRSPAEVAATIERLGLEPVWKDWDRGFCP